MQEGLGPRLRQAPGFLAYYVLDVGNNTIVGVSLFESKAAAEHAEAQMSGWVRQHMAGLASSPPSIAAGLEPSSRRRRRT